MHYSMCSAQAATPTPAPLVLHVPLCSGRHAYPDTLGAACATVLGDCKAPCCGRLRAGVPYGSQCCVSCAVGCTLYAAVFCRICVGGGRAGPGRPISWFVRYTTSFLWMRESPPGVLSQNLCVRLRGVLCCAVLCCAVLCCVIFCVMCGVVWYCAVNCSHTETLLCCCFPRCLDAWMLGYRTV